MKLRVAFPFLLLVVALVISNGLATAAPAANDGGGRGRLDPVVGDRTCGTPDANPAEMEAVRAQVRAWLARVGPSAASGGTIAVAFHVLHDGPAGDVPDAQIDQQMKALNQSYAGTGYRFSLTSVDRADNRTWFGSILPGNGVEKHAKQALAIDPAHHLNVYTCSPGQGLLGWAYFPFSLPESHYLHGVVIHYGSLPGGFIDRYNLGLTLVHESGHYLGLFHTFQGGCTPPGDDVDDTPFEASPAYGCPIGRNTCPQPGDDPIHNYMDYTDDACYTEFTGGQLDRINSILPVYRPSLLRSLVAQAVAGPGAEDAVSGPAARGTVEFRGAFPNPFARATMLRYTLAERGRVSLAVYNVAGQRVATLADGEEDAGEHHLTFAPRGVAPGMYFAVLRARGMVLSRSAVLIP